MDPVTLAVLSYTVGSAPGGDKLVAPDHLGAMIVLHRSFAEAMPEFPVVEAEAGWLLGGRSDSTHGIQEY